MLRLTPFPATEIPLEAMYQDLQWPAPPQERPFVALNMVTTLDGRVALEGRAQPIGSRTDHRVMRQIRAHADAVMVGAGTLRAENVNPSVPESFEAERVARGLSPQPLAVVVSGSLDLPLEGTFLRAARQRRLVITSTKAPPEALRALRSVVRVILPDERRLDLARGLRVLRQDLGVRWLLAEGGPTLNASLLDGGLLDELFLTVSPRLVGGPERALLAASETPAAARRTLTLLSVHAHEHELFLRYAVSPLAGTPSPPG